MEIIFDRLWSSLLLMIVATFCSIIFVGGVANAILYVRHEWNKKQ